MTCPHCGTDPLVLVTSDPRYRTSLPAGTPVPPNVCIKCRRVVGAIAESRYDRERELRRARAVVEGADDPEEMKPRACSAGGVRGT